MNPPHFRLCRLLAALGLATTLPAKAPLTGRITGDANQAVAGATIFVYTAAPRTGTSPFCPSCYPDCGKSVRSDAEGKFMLAGLSDDLVFRLLIVAEDHLPKFVPRLKAGEKSVDIELLPRRDPEIRSGQIARGRIVDATGAPVYGAVVEVKGVDLGAGRRRWGGTDDLGIDPLAVTNEAGEFEFGARAPFPALHVRVSARGFASQNVRLALGRTQTLALAEGATLSGRVTFEGKPLPNVAVGVSAQDHAAETFAGYVEVGTDAEGRFHLANLPAKTDYYLYGLMETIGRHGVIATRPVHVGRDGSITDVGDLVVRPGHRLSGRVVLEDRAPLPDNTRLLVGRDTAWDSLQVVLGPGGEFDLAGVPPEVIELSLRVPGYQFSAKNQSYESSGRLLVGRMSGDATGLEVLLEKIPALKFDFSEAGALARRRSASAENPRERPLRGVEAR